MRKEWVWQKHLAHLWRLDGGKGYGVSVFPVLALLGRGFAVDGRYEREDRLREVCGLGRKALARGLTSSDAAGAIELLPGAPRGVHRFRCAADVLTDDPGHGFYFPGRIVTSGLWAELTAGERVVSLALAALSGTHFWEDLDYLLYEPSRVRQWLESHDAVWAIPQNAPADAPHTRVRSVPRGIARVHGALVLAKRYGRPTMAALSNATGMAEGSVSQAVRRLARRADGRFIAVDMWAGGFGYHLPDEFWGPALPPASHLTGGSQFE